MIMHLPLEPKTECLRDHIILTGIQAAQSQRLETLITSTIPPRIDLEILEARAVRVRIIATKDVTIRIATSLVRMLHTIDHCHPIMDRLHMIMMVHRIVVRPERATFRVPGLQARVTTDHLAEAPLLSITIIMSTMGHRLMNISTSTIVHTMVILNTINSPYQESATGSIALETCCATPSGAILLLPLSRYA
jgi:hypothetical protein